MATVVRRSRSEVSGQSERCVKAIGGSPPTAEELVGVAERQAKLHRSMNAEQPKPVPDASRDASVPGIMTPIEIDGFGGTILWVGRLEGGDPERWCFGFRLITSTGDCSMPVDDSHATCGSRDLAIETGLSALFQAGKQQGCFDTARLALLKQACDAAAKKHARRRGTGTLPPGATSTTTPAGIATNNPDGGVDGRQIPTPKAQRAKPAIREEATGTLSAAGGEPKEVGHVFLVELDRLGRNRFNPRERFDEKELAEFAAKLERDGQLQPVLVRRATGPGLVSLKGKLQRKYEAIEYEIVAGERRALAAVRAGWECVKAQEVEADDSRACELAIAENRDRKDISQVEYARSLQKLADLKGLDPEGLAKDQGVSAQHVRNLLRLLKTPPEWQQLVIDGKLDGTHLRAAAPFLHVPAVAKSLKKEIGKAEEKPSVAEWEDDVWHAVWRNSEGVDRHVHTPTYSKSAEVSIEPTHPQWAELDVVELKGRQLALNAKLAKKLLDEAEQQWQKKAAKKSDKQDQSAAERQAAMTPAERRKHAAEQQRKFDQRLENWFHDWLRVLCAAAIQPGGFCEHCESGALWLIAYAIFERPGNTYSERDVAEELAGFEAKRYEPDSVLEMLEPRNGHEAAELMHAYAARLLVNGDGSPRGPTSGEREVIYDRVVTVLARDVLGLDLVAAWKADRSSMMREKFWALHSKDQLVELGEELGVYITGTSKKSQAVEVFLAVERPLPLPKELSKLMAKMQPSKAKAKKPKRKPR